MIIDGDYHIHTNYSYCADKDMTADKVIETAKERNVKRIGIVNHSVHFYFPENECWQVNIWQQKFHSVKEHGNKNIEKYLNLMDMYRSENVLLGIELDYMFDGELVFDMKFKDRLDFVIGAVHHLPCQGGNFSDRQMTDEFIKYVRLIMDYPIDILAHPTRIFRSEKRKIPEEVVDLIIDLAESKNIAIELNCHGDKDPDEFFIEKCIKRGVKIAIGTDAHRLNEIGDFTYHKKVLANYDIELFHINKNT